MKSISTVIGAHNITICIDGETKVFARGNDIADALYAAIRNGDDTATRQLFNARENIEALTHGLITIKDNQFYYDGKVLHNALADRITLKYKNKEPVLNLLNFFERLKKNPSKRSVDELFGFLEKCNLPILDEGDLLAYKMVREDFMDQYSGTFDNSPGKVCEMPRNEVDDQKENTCSRGLHFASREYISTGAYGNGTGRRLVVVKIDPADVVSIPVDYNNSKGRTCRYEVVKEIDELRDITHDDGGESEEEIDPVDNWDDWESEEEEWVTAIAEEETEEEEETSVPVRLNPNAHLDENKVRQIRNMLEDKWTLTAIAEAMGVSRRTVGRIRDGELWTHVK